MAHSRLSNTIIAAALFVLLLVPAASLASDTFRCGNSLVRAGQTPSKVFEICGEPDARWEREEPVFVKRENGFRHQIGTRKLEYWRYERGTGQFPAVLTIEEGKVTSVELIRD